MNDLTEKLYQSITETRQTEARDNTYWHASDLSKCPRALYLQRLGTPPLATVTAPKILRWKVGEEVEKAIRPHLKALYPDLLSNVRLVDEELGLTGEIDNYDEASGTIIEIKSVHPQAVRYKRKDEDRYHLKNEQAYLAHSYQNHAYALLLQRQGRKVERIVYLYISLSGLLVPYEQRLDPAIVKDLTLRLEALREAENASSAPPCLCDPSHPLWGSQMQFCEYKGEGECCEIKKGETSEVLHV